MINDKSTTHVRSQQEAGDSLVDYDEVGGLLSEVRGGASNFSGEDGSYVGGERMAPKTTAEQQLLFTQLFDLLTEDHVDPMLGLFHFRKHRQDLIH